MTAVNFNASIDDDARRQRLYDGQLFVYAASDSTRQLCDFAREMTEQAFSPLHPTTAQHHMDVERYVEILAGLKPAFIHHPRTKELQRAVLAELGCDLEGVYFDVPRLRTVTHGGYLTSGLGYAFKPHRDLWYSTPRCQLNWWLPVYAIEPESTVEFFPHYWTRSLRNSSREFDYQVWCETGRKAAPKQIKSDTRKQAAAEEPVLEEPRLRIVIEPGGLLIFSAAHLHATVPNTSGRTRFSIDFRTVHLGDFEAERGAPNLDTECTGTTMVDYLRGTDFQHVPEELIARHAAAQARSAERALS